MFSFIVGSTASLGFLMYMIYQFAPTIATLILVVLLMVVGPAYIELVEDMFNKNGEEPP